MTFKNGKAQRCALALIAVLGLLLAACSSSSDSGAGAEPTDTAAPDGDASTYDRDAVVDVGIDLVQPGAGVFTLDPVQSSGNVNDALQYMVFGRLLRPEPDGSLVPDLAESADVTDATTIEVKVRPGITWQDGTPFTAESVKTGLDLSLASQKPNFGEAFFQLTSVDVVDPTTVQLNIPNGTAASWRDNFLGSWQTTIVKPGTNFDLPVGAGPMKVESYRAGETMELVRSENYWDAAAVNYAGMNLVHVDGTALQSGTAALVSGQLDFVPSDVAQLPSLTGTYASLKVPNPTRLVNAMICKDKAPLDDSRLRVAISKAINREDLGEAVFEGISEPATEPWPEGNRFYNPDVADELAYDPEGAKQLMADAGHPDGFEFDLYYLNTIENPTVAQVAQQQLAAVGITANIAPASDFQNDWLASGKSGAAVIGQISPGNARLNHWDGDTVSNVCDFNSPELKAMRAELDKVGSSSDEAVEIWQRIDAWYAEQSPSLLFVFVPNLAGYTTEVWAEPPATFSGGPLLVPDLFNSGAVAS